MPIKVIDLNLCKFDVRYPAELFLVHVDELFEGWKPFHFLTLVSAEDGTWQFKFSEIYSCFFPFSMLWHEATSFNLDMFKYLLAFCSWDLPTLK